MENRSLGSLAMTHSLVGFAPCLCLIVFYLGADVFGSINDVGNAVLGVLSGVLAWSCQQVGLRVRRLLIGVAVLGAAITVVGSVLVLTEATGFFLAGLVSSLGFALIGVWLVALSRSLSLRLRRSELIAGAVMLLGLVTAPGIAMGLDDMDTAPAWTFLGGLSWAGTYLLFPAWSFRLSQAAHSRTLL
jgi:hypothetical protein